MDDLAWHPFFSPPLSYCSHLSLYDIRERTFYSPAKLSLYTLQGHSKEFVEPLEHRAAVEAESEKEIDQNFFNFVLGLFCGFCTIILCSGLLCTIEKERIMMLLERCIAVLIYYSIDGWVAVIEIMSFVSFICSYCGWMLYLVWE